MESGINQVEYIDVEDDAQEYETSASLLQGNKKIPLEQIAVNSKTPKNYFCPNCPSGFTQRANLKRHMRFKCGQAPTLQCPYCEMVSKESSNVYRHMRARHPGKPLFIKHNSASSES